VLIQKPPECGGQSDDDDDVEDIEKAIKEQVQDLKEAGSKGERRFQNCLTGAKNVIFIKTTLEDPAALSYSILEDLLKTKKQRCRYALRMLPVVGTCKANVKEISELAKTVLQPFFTEKKFEVTYSIVLKVRNNKGLGRNVLVPALNTTIAETFPSVLLRVASVKPDIIIFVDVICGVACISVARDYDRFRKYNLVEIVNEKPVKQSDSQNSDNESECEASPTGTENKVAGTTETETVANQPEDQNDDAAGGKNGAASPLAEQDAGESTNMQNLVDNAVDVTAHDLHQKVELVECSVEQSADAVDAVPEETKD
jgi:tRNA acetyltransferase TAN1